MSTFEVAPTESQWEQRGLWCCRHLHVQGEATEEGPLEENMLF